MPINGRESNAPVNMLPYVRELESKLEDLENRMKIIESVLRAQRS